MKTEPLFTVGMITGVIVAIIGLLRAFGIEVSSDQENAIVQFITSSWEVVIVVGGFLVARNFVWSAASVEKLTGRDNPVVPEVPTSPFVTDQIRRN
jgi:uncharacterized membrane protein